MNEPRVASITALQPGAYLLPNLSRYEQISDFDLSVPVHRSASLLDWDVDLEARTSPVASAGVGSIPA